MRSGAVRALRNVYEDLVDRRLWPVAVVLLLALIAIPVVLAKPTSSPAPVASMPAVPASGPGEMTPFVGQPVVQLSSAPQNTRRLNHLPALNPFQQRHVPMLHSLTGLTGANAASTLGPAKAASSIISGGPALASAGPGSSSSGVGSSASSVPASIGGGRSAASPISSGPSAGSSGPSPSPSPPGSGTPPPAPHHARTFVVSSVDVSFGAAGETARRQTLHRLDLLPSRAHPVVVFLGLLGDAKTAQFLISSRARVQGDGRCAPSSRDCRTVLLKAGDTEFFDVIADDGSDQQFELDLLAVRRRVTTSAAAARSASVLGSRILRESAKQEPSLRAVRNDETTGTLEPQPPVASPQPAPAWESPLSPDAAVSAIPGLAPVPAPPAP